MADLVLDYALLHDLAGSMRSLRGQIETDVNTVSGRSVVSSNGEVGSDAVGNSTLFAALSAFYSACHTPFKDSMDKLKELADLLDSVAKAFFDVDADFAGKVNTGRLQAEIGRWQAKESVWEHYQQIKDKVITYQYYDENGVLQTAVLPLWDPKTPPPEQPGAMPTSLPGPGGATQTSAEVNDEGLITSETTTVNTPNGLSYTETTQYTYIDRDGDGTPDVVDYSTTITHSDGTTEEIVRRTNPDDTYVVSSTTGDGTTTTTVTPGENGAYKSVTVDTEGETTTTTVVVNADGTGTKTEIGPDGTDTYTGDPQTGQWTLQSHEDPTTYIPYSVGI